MQTKLFKYFNKILIIALISIVGISSVLTSCENEEEESKDVELLSFGPMPVARGGELRFIGKNLDKVSSIVLPDNISIANFTSQTSELITLTVPQEAVPGLVKIVHADGEITTKTPIGFSEPISIANLSPSPIKAGQELTITGDYLNLVTEVIFTDRVSVTEFVSQSRTQLKLLVPATAQTGKIVVSNGEEDPILVYSTNELGVVLPAITSITPNPVKAGTAITITGTNLDLVLKAVFGGNKEVTAFTSKTETQIVLNVPADAKDGSMILIPASAINITSASALTMVVPTVSVSPTTVKNGDEVVVTGTNLDLIDQVIFGGNKQGSINPGGSATQITVNVPIDAVSGAIKFITKADKEVVGNNLTFLAPIFTSFTPDALKAKQTITITGSNLDLVSLVNFTGGVSGAITNQTETELVVTVPVGATTGKITLLSSNGTSVQSASDLTMNVTLPDFISYGELRAEPGKKLTINGSNLSIVKEVLFPGDVVATSYYSKSDTKIEVLVPVGLAIGTAQIKIITFDGDEGLFPAIFIGSTEPVKDPALLINGFDEAGHDLGWDNWSGISERLTDANSISGAYLHGNANLNAWDWKWVWGCNHDQLVKPGIADAANYVLKLDVNITAITTAAGNRFQFKFAGTSSEWVSLGIKNADGTYSTTGWVTVTLDLVNDLKISGTIPASGEWGLILQPSEAMDFKVFNIDNIRFEAK